MKKPHGEHVDTQLARLGRSPSDHYGFVNTPPYRGSTILFETMDDLAAKRGRYLYGRRGTPTGDALHSAWAELSKAAGAVSVPSGLNAVALALLSCVKSGDHILVTDSVYYPTRQLCDGLLKNLGIETSYYDPAADIKPLLRANTAAVYAESPGSLTFEIQDIPALARLAHGNDALLLLDNTWATPLLFSPHEHGVDLAIEAGTKYLSGHSDVLMGLVSANEKAWPALHSTYQLLGAISSPDDQFLAMRGLRTLSLRLKHQEQSALKIAAWLQRQPEVKRVRHPALPDCPGHDIWKRDFQGSSGVFAVEMADVGHAALSAMLDNMAFFGMGFSWGGFESLIIPFDCSYRKDMANFCVKGLRLQIGLEDERDLIADLEKGFQRLRSSKA